MVRSGEKLTTEGTETGRRPAETHRVALARPTRRAHAQQRAKPGVIAPGKERIVAFHLPSKRQVVMACVADLDDVVDHTAGTRPQKRGVRRTHGR